MKKLILLLFIPLVFTCSSDDDEGSDCVYQPTITTDDVTNITESSATLNGTISVFSENCNSNYNTQQGFVYATETQPTINDIQVFVYGTSINSTLENLEPNTTYYVRTFLTNAGEEFYGNEVEFTTNEGLGFEVIYGNDLINCDGEPVPRIIYGNQEWAVQNACNTSYRDGTPIPEVSDGTQWNSLTTGAWSYYNNDPTKPRLYNWYAIMGIYDAASLSDPSLRKEFAPVGWHVPSDTEWTILEEYLISSGYNYDGTTTGNKIGKAMASTSGWGVSTIEGAVGNDPSLNNSSGFNALPVGIRVPDGFMVQGSNAVIWTSTENEDNPNFAWYRNIGVNRPNVIRPNNIKHGGWSVRLVKND